MTTEQLKQAMWRMFGYGAKDYHGCARQEIEQVEAQLSIHTSDPILAQAAPPATAMRDDDLWHIAGVVTSLNGGNLFNVSQQECVTAIRAAFMDPDAGRAFIAAQTAEPYGYVLKTGHGTAFRENLAGVEPDFVKHWVPLYDHPAKTEQPPQNCREAGPGKGLCDHCAAGNYERCRYVVPAAVQTEQPSLSDHEIYVFLCDLTVLRQACETDEELIPKVRALLAQRQDSDKDAERYRKAIAYEDNAGLLYCAVMNHCPDKAAIDAEFDAEAIDIAIANGAPK